MSTQEREILGSGIAGLSNISQATTLDAAKSLVRYIFTPFVDINLAGPNGLLIRLGKGRDYYGQMRRGHGATPYSLNKETGQVNPHNNIEGETYEQYVARKGAFLERCVAYPLWNIQYNETVTNLGRPDVEKFNRGSGNDLGSESNLEEVMTYAGVCAADMVQQYGQSHGLRELTPLTGMEDAKVVNILLNLVIPDRTLKLTNLAQEEAGELKDVQTLLYDLSDTVLSGTEHGPARERIQGANLDAELSAKAEQLRRVCLAGVRQACTTARTDFYDLKKQLGDAALGKVGNKSQPSAYDAQVCWLLGEAVPSAVARPTQGTDPELTQAVKLLSQHVIGGGGQIAAPDDGQATELRQLIAEAREATAALAKAQEAAKRGPGGKFAKAEPSGE